eukprot:CAMPEP_0115686170 /NCGR_PEP_ID=MMETSP0272-20121206/59826_1 /TAXON_ID=71861 /ORGANISM="Scrippsiella trochoidea, Strain CCMP3099" /LENGTH=386 /DNA_ID=CAMNT_0003125757 /DNA_START=1 /DNA_END=1161 /DNA_ORIENTATION=+
MVQQMMSDPEMLRTMMRMNPQLNQLMEQRPEIARLLEDPEVLQQSMRMMANPSLMREMTRNADRAIGNLDAMPGGHNALVQAHQEIADPLFTALAGSAGEAIAQNVASYAQQTEGLPNNEALPNPWGAPGAALASAPQQARRTVTNGLSVQQLLGSGPRTSEAPAPSSDGSQLGGGNPMAAMMQQMMSNPAQLQDMMGMTQQLLGGGMSVPGLDSAPTAAETPAADTSSVNPMAAMMQQMMSNPAQMQQMMNMTQQLFGSAAPTGAGTNVPAAPEGSPMPAMMQQMMSNPAQMQHMMNMTQQLLGGGSLGGGLMPEAASGPVAMQGGDAISAVPVEAQQRVRFAEQLSQLMAMGFTNEALCLRALAQHNGRVDAAIDTLLASGGVV